MGNFTKKILLVSILFLGMQAMLNSCGAKDAVENKITLGSAMLKSFADEMKNMLYGQFLPSVALMEENGHTTCWLLQEQIESLIPFYGYLAQGEGQEGGEEALDIRTILLAEAEEGTDWQEDMEAPENAGLPENAGSPATAGDGPSGESMGETLEELLRAENDAALQMQQGQGAFFIPHAQVAQVDLGSLKTYATLVQQFYTVDASTSASSDRLDVIKFLEADMTISKENGGPQILIYHTHSQEAFADSVPGDSSTTIMGVGERLASILTEQYGYEVLHYLGQYDVDSRDDAYANALTDIERVLKENPSIQVVIDLHRDEMPEGTRLVMDLDGRPTARFMFFNGLSRTKKTGDITYLYNENLDSNLAFSFQMQLKAMEYYPGLTRKIYLKAYRYNMHLMPRYLLIELGAQNNTVEEAMNACDPLAHILDMVLSGE